MSQSGELGSPIARGQTLHAHCLRHPIVSSRSDSLAASVLFLFIWMIKKLSSRGSEPERDCWEGHGHLCSLPWLWEPQYHRIRSSAQVTSPSPAV